MFKLLVFISIAVYCKAGFLSGLSLSNPYNRGFFGKTIGFDGRIDGQFGGHLKSASTNSYNSVNTLGSSIGAFESPIHSQRTVEVSPLSSSHDTPQEQIIDVPPDESPVTIHFRTHANPVIVHQTRTPSVIPEVEHTSSEDEPHRVVHEVVKPVIQEIHEIIQPYRRVVQQIEPVIEELHTVVAKGEPRGRAAVSSSPETLNTVRERLPRKRVFTANGVPVYRSLYKGPASPRKGAA